MKFIKTITLLSIMATLSFASYVAIEDLNVRESASLKSQVVNVYLRGERVDVIKKIYTKDNGTWYHTSEGYISIELLHRVHLPNNIQIINESDKKSKKVYVEYFKDLPIYKESNKNNAPIGLLKANVVLDVECEITNRKEKHPWFKTDMGYIQSPYLYNPGLLTSCLFEEKIYGNFAYAKSFANEEYKEKEEKKIHGNFEYAKAFKNEKEYETKKKSKPYKLFVGALITPTLFDIDKSNNLNIDSSLDDTTIGFNIHGGIHYNEYLDFILNYDYLPFDDTTLNQYYLSSNYKFNHKYNPYVGISVGMSQLSWTKDPLTNSDTKDKKSQSNFFFGIQGGIEHKYTNDYSVIAQVSYQALKHTTDIENGTNTGTINHTNKLQIGMGLRYEFEIK